MAISTEQVESFARNGYVIIDNFLNSDEYRNILDHYFSLLPTNKFQYSKIGKDSTSQQDRTIRGDKICWLDPHEPTKALHPFFQKLTEIQKITNENFYLGIKDFEALFAYYEPGSFYKKHSDQFHHDSSRQLTYVFYMNDNWQEGDGGELLVYNLADELVIKVAPTGNRLILFLPREFPHEVLQCSKERKSIVGWFHNKLLT